LPKFLPDGRHFIFNSSTAESNGLHIASVDSGEVRRVNGVVAYRNQNTQIDLVWLSRTGDRLGVLGTSTRLSGPQLSPDGKQVAVNSQSDTGPAIWLVDVASGAPSRWTLEAVDDQNPVWSPDGRQVLYTADYVSNRFDLYLGLSRVRPSDDQLFLSSEFNKRPFDWSQNGFILYGQRDQTGARDLWAVRADDREKRLQITRTSKDETQAQFSPDGNWIAYTSNETGQYEVWVQNFPTPTFKKLISNGGGVQPRWRPDGTNVEFFYIASSGELMSVKVKFSSKKSASEPEFSVPAPLFKTNSFQGFNWTLTPQYDLTDDGQRFLIARPTENSTEPITVVINWPALLKK
jgi:eukaryotic-like serine/threonine-protein kinase